MRAGRRAQPLLVTLLLSFGMVVPASQPARRFYVGRPLTQSIEELRSEGLALIYSSDLVRPSLRVLAEPVATTPRAILEDLISPHGLEIRDGPGGTLLIVKRDPSGGPVGGIAGRVVSAGDRMSMPGARVSVAGTPAGTVAAPDGRFLLFRLPPGTWPLEVQSADGKMREIVHVTVKADEMARVLIELAPARTLIEAIVVTPTHYRIVSDQPETRRSIEGERLARLAHLGDDALRAAAVLPGTASGDKSARFSLRGGEYNEELILLDDLEIDQPFHLREFLAFSGIIDSRAIERIDLLTGGFPVEYGDRMSGVMELTSSIPTERAATSLGGGTLNSWAMTRGRTDAGDKRWLVSTRAWYPDALFDLVDPGGEDLNPSYYDMLGKLELRRDNGTAISGHVLAARDLIRFTDTDIGETVRARYDTAYAWINIKSPWTPRLFSLTQLSLGRVESDRLGRAVGARSSSSVADERSSGFQGARQDWVFRGSDQYILKWGFDARALDAEYDYSSHAQFEDPIFAPPASPVLIDRQIRARPSGLRLGAYAAARAKLTPSLTAEIGLRWGRQTYSRDAQIDPRINLILAAGSRSTVRAAWGLFHQSQRIDELQVEDGVSGYSPAQLAEHRLISFEHESGAGSYFRADGYWKVMSHLRPRFENLFNPNELLPETGPDRVRIAPRRAASRGIELFFERDASKRFDWWVGYALASSEDEIGGRSEPRSWDQTHSLSLGLGYRFEPGWEIDLAGLYHSGWPTTGVQARTVTDPNGMATLQPALDARNGERFSPYHRLDLRLLRNVKLRRSSLTIFLDVLNLYDRKNVCCVDDFRFRTRAGGDVRVDRHEGFWLRRIPSMGIAWEF